MKQYQSIAFSGLSILLMFIFQSCPRVPPDVDTEPVTDITKNSAIVIGTVINNGGLEIVERGICYGTALNPTERKEASTGGMGAFQVTLTGLSPSTPYFVRAYAVNDVDIGYGDNQPFQTLPEDTVPEVTTISVSNITENSASSGGNVTSDGGAAVTARGVCWSTSQNPSISDKHTTDGSGTGSFTSTIDELTCEKTYYLRAYATNSAGTAYGSQMSFETGECTTVTDVDGNIYQIVKIGNQTWMKENLKVTHFADGTSIPLIKDNTAWGGLEFTDKGYCWYDNQSSYGDIYGALYTWPAAMNSEASTDANPSGVQGVCPDGWHLPSDSEWKELEMYLGMSQSEADVEHYFRGTDEGGKLKETNTTHWTSPNTGATNISGFTALPGGSRSGGGSFLNLHTDARFWTATAGSGIDEPWVRRLSYNEMRVERNWGSYSSINGFSVRCVKD